VKVLIIGCKLYDALLEKRLLNLPETSGLRKFWVRYEAIIEVAHSAPWIS
jgi:hypothetical protein